MNDPLEIVRPARYPFRYWPLWMEGSSQGARTKKHKKQRKSLKCLKHNYKIILIIRRDYGIGKGSPDSREHRASIFMRNNEHREAKHVMTSVTSMREQW